MACKAIAAIVCRVLWHEGGIDASMAVGADSLIELRITFRVRCRLSIEKASRRSA